MWFEQEIDQISLQIRDFVNVWCYDTLLSLDCCDPVLRFLGPVLIFLEGGTVLIPF